MRAILDVRALPPQARWEEEIYDWRSWYCENTTVSGVIFETGNSDVWRIKRTEETYRISQVIHHFAVFVCVLLLCFFAELFHHFFL